MPRKQITLTRARIAALCAELVRARTRALAHDGSETSATGQIFVAIGFENALLGLVRDLGGDAAADMVSDSIGSDIKPAEVDAYRRERDARQRAYLDAYAAKVAA